MFVPSAKKAATLVAALVFAAAAAGPSAYAFPVTLVGANPFAIVTTTDPATENNTQLAAWSLTTRGNGGWYVPNASFINSLNQPLFQNINPQVFDTDFPGWVPPGNDSTTAAVNLTAATLQTYKAAMLATQSQMTELAGENFSNVESASLSAASVLAAIQANTDAVLQVAAQIQLLRQQQATQTMVETTQAAQQLSLWAQEEAGSANLSLAPTGQ
jgi:hypothetical protein